MLAAECARADSFAIVAEHCKRQDADKAFDTTTGQHTEKALERLSNQNLR